MRFFRTIGQLGFFTATFSKALFSHPPPIARSFEEGFRIGVKSLPILLIISFFVGTNLSIQGFNVFKLLGATQYVGMFVALAGVRELAPIMVAALVSAKAGTEMASQIAVMRIREEIDALHVMAINPYWYLIAPRFLGILIVLPALTVLSIFTLIGSAWLVAVLQLGLNSSDFLLQASHTMQGIDLVYCGIKAIVFGSRSLRRSQDMW